MLRGAAGSAHPGVEAERHARRRGIEPENGTATKNSGRPAAAPRRSCVALIHRLNAWRTTQTRYFFDVKTNRLEQGSIRVCGIARPDVPAPLLQIERELPVVGVLHSDGEPMKGRLPFELERTSETRNQHHLVLTHVAFPRMRLVPPRQLCKVRPRFVQALKSSSSASRVDDPSGPSSVR